MKRLYAIVVALCLLSGGAAWAVDETQSKTEYMALLVGGQKLGYVANVRLVAAGKVTTTQSMVLTIKRMGMELKLKQSETSVETTGGAPLSFSSSQDLGIMVQTTEGTVTDGKAKVKVSSGPKVREMELDWPEGAMLPEGLRLLSLRKGFKQGTTYSARAFMPSMLKAFDANTTIGARKQIDLLGRVVELIEVKSVLDSPQGRIETVGYVDDDGETLKTVTSMMGMQMEMVACTREFALMPVDSIDIFDKVLVSCPTPLSPVGEAKAVTYRIEATDGSAKSAAKLKFLDSPSQKVAIDGNSVVVTVRPVAVAGGALPYKGSDPAALKALKATAHLQSDAKEIMALSRKAVAGANDAACAARQIQDFVSKYVTVKDLSVGYATALEVAKSRQGDCTEHAALAAAMCRSAGVPAQVVTGLAYVKSFAGKRDIFVPHAWFRVFIDGAWVDYDAALKSFDAGHIALVAGDGDPSDFFAVVNTLGNFRIAEAKRRRR